MKQCNSTDSKVIVDAVPMSMLKPEKIKWLWPGFIPLGKLTILAGTAGTGKTTLAMEMSSIVSSGKKWPDDTRSPIGSVLIWSGEDDCKDTLLPRLIAMGAIRDKIYFINGVYEDGKNRSFDPSRDIPILLDKVKEIGDVKLIIIDPIANVVRKDSHKNTDVRLALQPLVDLASIYSVSIIGITHFTKGTAGSNPLERVTGSLAFGAMARMVLVTSKKHIADGEFKYVMARAKSNISEDGGGYFYNISQVEIPMHDGLYASKVNWGNETNESAMQLLKHELHIEKGKSASDEAKDFLKNLLADGPVHSVEVFDNAMEAGISKSTLDRAKRPLGIEPYKMNDKWWWELPRYSKPQGTQI